MGPSTGNIPPPNDGSIIEALKKSVKKNITVVFHAENEKIVEFFTEKLKSSGRTDPKGTHGSQTSHS